MPDTPDWMTRGESRAPVDLKTDRPHAARVYDVLLGGKTNYEPDRAMAAQVVANVPTAQPTARANRDFMLRATRYLAAEAGVRQFLDIGTGIPTQPNLHEAAQSVAPDSRVVYVDNDPIVLAHSRALHTSDPAGRTAYIDADASDPDGILASALLRETLDLDRPVALSMCLLLHWLPATADPYAVVRRLVDELVPGSFLVITHLARDLDQDGVGGLESDFESSGSQLQGRTKDEVLGFFDGLSLIEPGLVVPHMWRPEPVAVDIGSADMRVDEHRAPIWAGVAAKKD
ncbi:SAM-dependent methyltransferase [Streptomyces montanisoli]|uniref:SAM-dependent methyltransferase n=1 Tax=Streptomyces montanisoli TaxID=2798581 RepID=A0A940RWN5_9ACTN|nr:SAM-dependent methyltransferase [Streptomyces montanisoli]MBP0457298.1 SAM-dependent methyltransferase [Streptomyces montanisoli]